VFAALTAVGVGVRLGVEEALHGTAAAHAAAVLGIGLAFALFALSLIQSAAPAGLPVSALKGRTAVALVAIATASLGGTWSASVVVGVLAGGVCAAVVLEEALSRARDNAEAFTARA
jgi:hypothetical protein